MITFHILGSSRQVGKVFECCLVKKQQQNSRWLYSMSVVLFSTSGLFIIIHILILSYTGVDLLKEQTLFTFGFLPSHYVVNEVTFTSTFVMFTFALLFRGASLTASYNCHNRDSETNNT